MDIATKIFLINWAVLVVFLLIDNFILKWWLNDNLQYAVGAWLNASFISIPAYIVYQLVTWGEV